jgi:hypothetical protein
MGSRYQCSNGAQETLSKNNAVINIEMKRDKRSKIVAKCESILKELGYDRRAEDQK